MTGEALKINRKFCFSRHFSSVEKVFSRENASFLLHRGSFCHVICEKKRHSRKFMPLISRFFISRNFLPAKVSAPKVSKTSNEFATVTDVKSPTEVVWSQHFSFNHISTGGGGFRIARKRPVIQPQNFVTFSQI